MANDNVGDVSTEQKEESKLSKLGLLLKQRGISQAQFIDIVYKSSEGKVKYTGGRVSRYVNNKVQFMTSDTLKVIAKALNVPVSDIMP